MSSQTKSTTQRATAGRNNRVRRYDELASTLVQRGVLQQYMVAVHRNYVRTTTPIKSSTFISLMRRIADEEDIRFQVDFTNITNARTNFIINNAETFSWLTIQQRNELIRLGTSRSSTERQQAVQMIINYNNTVVPLQETDANVAQWTTEGQELAQRIVEAVNSTPAQHVDTTVNIVQFQTVITEIGNLYTNNPNMRLRVRVTNPNTNEESYITITGTNIDEIMQQLQVVDDAPEEHGSDAVGKIKTLFDDFNNIQVRFERFVPTTAVQREQQQGALFKYINNSDVDLTRYGIYNSADPELHRESCLFKALKEVRFITKEQIDTVKQVILPRSHMIPMSHLKVVAETLKMRINLRIQYDNNKYKYNYYGTHFSHTIDLILLNITGCDGLRVNHYIAGDLPSIVSTIETLMASGQFIPMNNEELSLISGQYFQATPSTNIDIRNYPIETVEIEPKKYRDYVSPFTYCDFESNAISVKSPSGTDMKNMHRAYLGAMYVQARRSISAKGFAFLGRDCGYQMLLKAKEIAVYEAKRYNNILEEAHKNNLRKDEKPIKPSVVMLFHNMKFDWQFIYKYVTVVNPVQLDARLISVDCVFQGVTIIVRDSYSMISAPLSTFDKMFKFEVRKEVMPYSFYDKKSVANMSSANYQDVLKHVKPSEVEQFVNNVNEWKCLNDDNTVDMLNYSKNYCLIDCEVLMKGWEITRNTYIDKLGLDINNGLLTVSSLAHQYMIKSGAYDGCLQLKGFVQRYIQGCVRGGTTRTANNQRYHLNEKLPEPDKDGNMYVSTIKTKSGEIIRTPHKDIIALEDFDAVSLYPSAMVRMTGALKGAPKLLTSQDIENINNQVDRHAKMKYIRDNFSAIFADVRITRVGKNLNMPVLSERDSNGILQFTNNIKGKVFRLDDITIENLVLHQQVSFTVLQGYKFDEGFNDQFGKSIQYLFNMRKELKDAGNPAEQCIKLCLNSCYGKLVLKFRDTETKIVTGQKNFDVFVQRNWDQIKGHKQISYEDSEFFTKDVHEIKVRNNNGHEHVNMCHIGSQVLAMSKMIMHEVLHTAENLDIMVYYQDTDSLQFYKDRLPELEEAYLKKYGRVLAGNNLGQFNCDFKCPHKCKNLCGGESIYLGKKLYCVRLSCGAYHTKCKGVSSDSMKFTAKQLNINDIQLYKRLFDGETIDFDLTCQGSKFVARYTSDGIQALQSGQFTRKVRVAH